MGKRKREKRVIHPRNKYAQSSPDFALLASLYPSFEPYVVYSRDGRAGIDWLDYNSTRELTRILLHHDHGISWWIPDGQLCPAVPNRSNYICWINDLLADSKIFLEIETRSGSKVVKGFDIGTGANCIYPLLGASLHRWSFVGSDVTEVALSWASKNVESNHHISELIEIRKVSCNEKSLDVIANRDDEVHPRISSSNLFINDSSEYCGPPVLLGVVKEGETFDFCMCNPPFFATMEEAGLNPNTCFGGTPEEMVCNGGEHAFITRIIEDSLILKENFRWYTSMLGKKANLKSLCSKLWEVGATVVKSTEFVQGQTSRWGIAWSFLPTVRKLLPLQLSRKTKISCLLEGVAHHHSALDVLLSVESFFSSCGASCTLNTTTFSIVINALNDQCGAMINQKGGIHDCTIPSLIISVFQQTPGTLLVQGSTTLKDGLASGSFSLIMQRLEETLRSKFCKGKCR